MPENNMTYLRDDLEQMTTQQLDEMLQAELNKESIDDTAVRLILSVLEAREADYAVEIDPETEEAWEKYQSYFEGKEGAFSRPARKLSWLPRVASIVLIVGLLLVIVPQTVAAESFFEMLARWTDSVFEFFSPNTANNKHVDYVFETDNPGLQQVYDAVVELGVTEPVVPMWLPDGYELVDIVIDTTPTKTGLTASFTDADGELIYKVDIYGEEISHEYHKDEIAVDEHELEGTVYNIMRNNGLLVAVWTKDNVECSVSVDCQEDTLYNILESIYVMEDE